MCLAVPGKLLSVEGSDASPMLRSGKVSFGGIVRQVNLACVPEAKVGDWVLIHAGFAITQLDEAEALETYDLLKQMGDS